MHSTFLSSAFRATRSFAVILAVCWPFAMEAGAQGYSAGGQRHFNVPLPNEDEARILLKYDLEAGESITFRALSFDSIVIWDEEPRTLVRERAELITYACDTVLADGFGMTVSLDEIVVRQRVDTMPWRTMNIHPWVRVPVRFLMDETGMRIRLRDTLDRPGSMPGAVFQPLLFPHFGPADSVSAGEGHVFDRDMYLLDNVYPPVKWTGGFLRKTLGMRDSGHDPVMAVELSETGQLRHDSDPYGSTPQSGIQTHVRVNGAGTYFFDAERGLPVAGEYQMIANLVLTDQETGKEREGRQLIFMEFEEASELGTPEELFGETK